MTIIEEKIRLAFSKCRRVDEMLDLLFRGSTPDPKVEIVDVGEDIEIPDFHGRKSTQAVLKWLVSFLNVPTLQKIDATGKLVKINKPGLEASLKKDRTDLHRKAYLVLLKLIKTAQYDHFEKADERHNFKNEGQDVYLSALRINNKIYAVKLKFDIPFKREIEARQKLGERQIEDLRYKDHSIMKEMTLLQVDGVSSTQVTSAISNSEISPRQVDGVYKRPSKEDISEIEIMSTKSNKHKLTTSEINLSVLREIVNNKDAKTGETGDFVTESASFVFNSKLSMNFFKAKRII